jgi:hypothetical protein
MTDAQKQLLALCKPEVTLQAAPVGLTYPDESANAHFYVAEQCRSKGWLRFVRDRSFNQSTYRITQAGAAALAASQ